MEKFCCFLGVFSIEFFWGVRRGGPCTQSVRLVPGPGVSVFESPVAAMYPSATVVPGLLGDVEFLGEEAGKNPMEGNIMCSIFWVKFVKLLKLILRRGI